MTNRWIPSPLRIRVFGLALAFIAVDGTLSATRSRACSIAEPEIFEIDASLKASDTSAPTPFTDVSAEVARWPDSICKNGQCMASSCGAFGTVDLRFALPRDDRDTQLGYRLVWLRGTQPPALAQELEVIRPFSASFDSPDEGRISLTIGFEDAAKLDADIALVAIDRAGNESARSEPIHLTFSGCTHSLDGQCLESAGCGVTHLGSEESRWFEACATVIVLAAVCRRRWRVRS
jgi:hypothetical protein